MAAVQTTYTKRVQPKAAYKVATGKPKAVLAEITKGNLPTVTTAQEASHAAQAIQALPNGFNFDTESILTLLDQCSSVLVGKNTLSFVRRAICRVDEMLFADDAPDSSNHQI